MKKAGKLFVLGMIAMGVLSACGTKDEPNGAASKDVETSVRTAAPSYTAGERDAAYPGGGTSGSNRHKGVRTIGKKLGRPQRRSGYKLYPVWRWWCVH